MQVLSRSDCLLMDNSDPLLEFRNLFELPKELIYLDGNSLGALPKATRSRMNEVVDIEWGNRLIKSWNESDWINISSRVGDKIAGLVGANKGEVIVADSTSVNLFKLAAAAIKMNKGRSKIITEPGNFPTDLYILQGLEALLGKEVELQVVPREQLISAVDDNTALVVLTHVHYKSGEMFDMPALTAQVQAKGALMLWDLSHSTGAVPVALNEANADFAIGCGYKYLNGGPGAPAFLYIAVRHQSQARTPLTGWFGHTDAFKFNDEYVPATNINQFQCGTPSVMAASALEVGVDIMASADMALLRKKSRKMGELFLQLVEQECGEFGFTTNIPEDSANRGSQISINHPEGYAIVQALIARNIIGDFRAPTTLRFGFAPLYVRYVDIWDTIAALKDIMSTSEWDSEEFKAISAVT